MSRKDFDEGKRSIIKRPLSSGMNWVTFSVLFVAMVLNVSSILKPGEKSPLDFISFGVFVASVMLIVWTFRLRRRTRGLMRTLSQDAINDKLITDYGLHVDKNSLLDKSGTQLNTHKIFATDQSNQRVEIILTLTTDEQSVLVFDMFGQPVPQLNRLL